jgi:hypothetical protein
MLIICSCLSVDAQKKKKGNDKPKMPISTDYTSDDTFPDTLTKFTGIIKYRLTSSDPSDKDSMFIIFGENQIRFTMFMPGYKENEIFENNFIADFRDSSITIVDVRNKTYSYELFSSRNQGVEFALSNFKKTGQIIQVPCNEYSGEMTTKDGQVFQVASLVSKQHSYIDARDYTFLNIQPVIMGYKIVLGYRTKSSENESSFIVAYKIIPGDTSAYFDLNGYRRK